MVHVVIISGDAVFRHALSELVVRELAAQVTDMASPDALCQVHPSEIDLIVSTDPLPPISVPSLELQSGAPKKATALLGEIAARLTDRYRTPILLAEQIGLQEKSRTLERLDTGTCVELTEKEMALLLYIKNHVEAQRESILCEVWNMSPEADTHTLESHLYRLRQKWRELSEEDCIVVTKSGYRWAGND